MTRDNTDQTIAQLIAAHYITGNNISPYSTKLLRAASSYARFNIDELSLFQNRIQPRDCPVPIQNSTWTYKAKYQITSLIINFIFDRDVLSLANIFSCQALAKIVFIEKEEIRFLFGELINAIDISVDQPSFDSQIASINQYRKDHDLLLKTVRKGVVSKFLRNVCHLNSNQIALFQKLAVSNSPKGGGQTKINNEIRRNILIKWNENDSLPPLQRFQIVLDQTEYDSITVSRVISSLY